MTKFKCCTLSATIIMFITVLEDVTAMSSKTVPIRFVQMDLVSIFQVIFLHSFQTEVVCYFLLAVITRPPDGVS